MAPSAPLGVGNRGWPGLQGRGVVSEITFDKESKGHRNNSCLSLWVTWQELAGADRECRLAPTNRPRQTGRQEVPTLSGLVPGATAVTCGTGAVRKVEPEPPTGEPGTPLPGGGASRRRSEEHLLPCCILQQSPQKRKATLLS